MVDPEKKREKTGFTEKERRTQKVTQSLTAKLEAEQKKKRENPKIKELEKKADQLAAAGMTQSAERLRKQARGLR